MAGEPTAQLEAPAAITAVTSARQLLRVTYTGGPACNTLIVSSPNAPSGNYDPACPFASLSNYPSSATIPIHTDLAGQRYCDWTDYCGTITT
ncbi:MAG: hypothetical protein PHU85_11835, partial [Phycisphaerae bacterium]|nr:hypothetical protein [Phycisphaerae bacterium]